MRTNKILLTSIFIAIIIFSFYSCFCMGFCISDYKKFICGFGCYAPIVFILIFTILPVLFLPITPMTLTAGFLFGPVWGTIYSLIGASCSASLSFFVSRYLARDYFEKLLEGKINNIQENLEKKGWVYVAISRTLPFFPFNAQNYIFGLTNITFKQFLFPSFIFLIPALYVYVYIGYCGEKLIKNELNLFSSISIILLLVFFFVLTPLIAKKLKL